LTPRGQLHNESIYGSFQNEVVKNEKVDAKLTAEKIATVCNFKYRNVLLERLNAFDGDPKKAFTGKNSLEKNPIYLDELHTKQVPSLVKTKTYETVYTIRKAVAPDLNVDKVIDKKVQKVLNDRLTEFGNDPKQAFVNLKDNPIWLNKEKGISVTHVTIRGVSNAVSLRNNRDFVNTANNHHVAIFQDAKGDLQEHIISFLEATQRAVKGLPVVDKEFNQNLGWRFLFTMKQNEFFVFPNESTGFDPKQIDLLDPQNYAQISPNLFRVQKFSTKDYCFRHHLESTLGDVKSLQDITWKRIRNANGLRNCVKVRVNHIGQIVSVGEY
jgi:CRISPR-associated endonuclease Csn1